MNGGGIPISTSTTVRVLGVDPGSRSTGYACTLMGAGTRTQGVIICDQPRTLDFPVRGARYIETAPGHVTDDVLSRMAPLVT